MRPSRSPLQAGDRIILLGGTFHAGHRATVDTPWAPRDSEEEEEKSVHITIDGVGPGWMCSRASIKALDAVERLAELSSSVRFKVGDHVEVLTGGPRTGWQGIISYVAVSLITVEFGFRADGFRLGNASFYAYELRHTDAIQALAGLA